jgi:cytochrome c-type biogenesis protein CcmF
MAGALIDLAERTMILRIPLGAALRRAAGLPRSAWGTAVAHFGIGVTLLGIVVVTAWGAERIAALRPGETVDIAHYHLSFDGLFNRSGPNYREVVARFSVRRTNGDLLGVMEPSRRTFPARNMATTEAALMQRGVSHHLSLAWRYRSRWHRSGPALFQAAGAVDLARRADHVCRGRLVAVRSAAAHRRSGPRTRAHLG